MLTDLFVLTVIGIVGFVGFIFGYRQCESDIKNQEAQRRLIKFLKDGEE